MKKIFVIVIIVIIIVSVKNIFYGPSVSLNDRKNVKKYVENYLTKKYGNHRFKVTKIEYEYDMTTFFDYSNKEGFYVEFKSDIVKNSFVTILGINPYEFKIQSDAFLEDYYFPSLDGEGQHDKMKALIPIERINDNLLEKIKKDFDKDIKSLKCDNPVLDIPDNFGRVPTMNELKNDVSLYEIDSFNYIVLDKIENWLNYKNSLINYLKNNYGGNWDVYFNSVGSGSQVNISCSKQDD